MLGVQRVALTRRRSEGAELMKLKIALLATEPHACTRFLAAHAGELLGRVYLQQSMMWVAEMEYLFPKDKVRRRWELDYRVLFWDRHHGGIRKAGAIH